MTKKTLVVGASTKEARYSFKAAMMLTEYNHPIYLWGRSEGLVAGQEISPVNPEVEELDTITVYLSKENQTELQSVLQNLGAKRIIFNPGSENPDLYRLAQELGMEAINACTLVLLRTGQY